MHGMGDADMTAPKRSPRAVQVDSRFYESSDPFELMRVELDGLSIPAAGAESASPSSGKNEYCLTMGKASCSVCSNSFKLESNFFVETALEFATAEHLIEANICYSDGFVVPPKCSFAFPVSSIRVPP